MKISRLGLQAKLVIGSVLMAILFSAFFVLYFPSQQAKIAERGLKAHATAYARVLASLAASAVDLGAGGHKALEEDIAGWAGADPEILYVYVVKPDGSAFSRFSRGDSVVTVQEAYSPSASSSTDARALHVSMPVRVGGADSSSRIVGSVNLGMSRERVMDAASASQMTAVLVGVGLLVAGIMLSLLVGRSLVGPLLLAATQVHDVSRDIANSTHNQESASAQEAAAVAETKRSMELLYNSARQIAERSSEVLGNAEKSAVGSSGVAERIGDLNALSEKIAEILATIMVVADKADLLALNASLEGTKAGEAGKGFALVAAEMRRLAETVMDSVKGIRELMREMRDASKKAVEASDEGTRSSEATAESARKIAMLTQEQRHATEQVMSSMTEMASILEQNLEGVQTLSSSADSLAGLATTLSGLVNPSEKASQAS